MKREAIEQEERLKRLHAKIQKMEQDMAGLLRKRGANAAAGAAASAAAAKGVRDEEAERLQALIRERQFQADAMNKQLLIIKHTAPGAGRKPLSSIYASHGGKSGGVSAYGPPAPARRPQSAGGAKGKSGASALVSDTSAAARLSAISAQLGVHVEAFAAHEAEAKPHDVFALPDLASLSEDVGIAMEGPAFEEVGGRRSSSSWSSTRAQIGEGGSARRNLVKRGAAVST